MAEPGLTVNYQPGNALNFLRPDVDAFVWSMVKGLTPHGKSLRSVSTAAVPRPAPPGWLVAVTIQLDAWGHDRQAAFSRAVQARQIMLGLAYARWEGGVVTGVDILEDAFWNEVPNEPPRYTARYVVTAHPHVVAARPLADKELTSA